MCNSFILIFIGILSKSFNCQVISQYLIFFKATFTNLTQQSTNSTLGNYWNLNLTTSGQPQLFELSLAQNQFPGIFTYSSNTESLHLYAITNCLTSCTYNHSQNASETNYCYDIHSTTWRLGIDTSNISTGCLFQFYIDAQNNTIFNFEYLPQFKLQDSHYSLTAEQQYYLKYNFDSKYQNISNAHFYFFLTAKQNITLNFGTTEEQYQCNYMFPTAESQCQNFQNPGQNSSETYKTYTIETKYSNSAIYIGAYVNSSENLVLSTTCGYSCYSGYYTPTFQTSCIIIPTCPEGKYFDQSKQKCTACSDTLSYCKLCLSSTVCTECLSNSYTLVFNKCKQICLAGQYTSTGTATDCQPCMHYCNQCSSATTCEQCNEPTYVWNDDKKACISVCSKDGEYYSSSNQECSKCEVTNCLVCYGAGNQCSECYSGYQIKQLQNGKVECYKDAFKFNILAIFWLVALMIFF